MPYLKKIFILCVMLGTVLLQASNHQDYKGVGACSVIVYVPSFGDKNPHIPEELALLFFSFLSGNDFDAFGATNTINHRIQDDRNLLHLRSLPFLATLLMSADAERRFKEAMCKKLMIKRLRQFEQRLDYHCRSELPRQTLIYNWQVVYNALVMAHKLGDESALNELEDLKKDAKLDVQNWSFYARPDRVSSETMFKREYVPFAKLCFFDPRDPEEIGREYRIRNKTVAVYKRKPRPTAPPCPKGTTTKAKKV